MTPQQLTRLEYLDSVEFRTPDEEAEFAHLLHLQSGLRRAFEQLQDQGFCPTWVGGEYIIANVPGVQSLPGGKTAPFTKPEIIRSEAHAFRLISACS